MSGQHPDMKQQRNLEKVIKSNIKIKEQIKQVPIFSESLQVIIFFAFFTLLIMKS